MLMKTLTTTLGTLSAGLVMTLASARGQTPAGLNPASTGPIEYSTVQFISSNDSSMVIAEKAAKVLPRPSQIAWMRLERTFFIHYGPNAFNGVEWGTGREDPTVFNPTAFDANQWMSAVKNAGGNLVVLVCKHHDGYCLWPTRYTSQSVVSSPWLGGKGDVVGAVAKAARAQGIKLGVYLSPADLYQLRTNPRNPAGYYGDGSSNVLSTIPTEPASFKTDPSKGRTPPAGFLSYTYEVDDYNRYFLNQLYELLTEFGPIAEVWFDGANPDRSVRETYDRQAWYDLIRKLQPGAVIAVKGPDVRWVGNENGVGRVTEWSVIPLSAPPDTFTWPDMGGQDLGSRAKLAPGSYLWWYPAEVNTTIINGWFWAATKRPKSAQQLIDVFYQSVGRNGNMLLNLSPDNRGLVPENQLASLSRMAQVVNDTFATDLAASGKLEADSSNPTNSPALALDKNLDTWWEAAPGRTNSTLTLTLPSPITFDVVSLQEAVEHRSQRIESVTIETWNGTEWAPGTQLTTVGRKRIQRLSTPVTTAQVRIRINGSRMEPTLSELGLFKQAVAVASPVISERDARGAVTLSNTEGLKMVFTTNGTAPNTNSAVYGSPISLPLGGTIQAACLTAQGRLGMVASKTFAGMSPIGWKVVAVDNQEAGSATNAIDGSAATLWQTSTNAGAVLPHFITIDIGTVRRIAGLTYMPRQDGSLGGVVENYRFETSTDGNTWTTNVASGRFGNIRNNPILQEMTFAPIAARYFRFTALQEVNGNGWTSAAELSVLPAEVYMER
jgi:alpha-L-fucosidase